MTFLPQDYKIPTTSNYMKFADGNNTFRVLSSTITGYAYWNTENKPVRLRTKPNELPKDIRMQEDGSYSIKHFWAFVVWNYRDNMVQILEITQKDIMKGMLAIIQNPKWGNPTGYDIVVNRTGKGLQTKYTVNSDPHSPISQAIVEEFQSKKINLEALYDGQDPFMNTSFSKATPEASSQTFKSEVELVTEKQFELINNLMEQKGISEADIITLGFSSLKDLTGGASGTASELINYLIKAKTKVNPNGVSVEELPTIQQDVTNQDLMDESNPFLN